MNIILVPGLWLDGSTWNKVTPALETAGHRTHALTPPGMESKDADRSGVTRQDHVEAVVAAIDSADSDRVVLVGHSAGAAIAYAAVDARPDRVARAIFISGFPLGDGEADPGGFSSHDGEIPFPEWSDFDEDDLADLDEAMLARFREQAIPSPAGAALEPQRLSDERRYDVPVTMICNEFSSEVLRSWIERDLSPVREFTRIKDVTYVDLPTGHWPQFTRPEELARLLLDAAARG